MSAHRWIWWGTVLGVVTPAALLSLYVAPTAWLVVTTSALGLGAGARLSGARWSWHHTGESATAAVLLLDAVPLLAWRALPVLVLLVGTSARFVRALRARAGVCPVAGKRDRVTSACSTYVGACLEAMSGHELCRAWRASFVQVKSTDLRERKVHAGVRTSLLDELERRDAGRFHEWLGRSPSAAGDPLWVISLPHRPRQR